MDGPSLAFCHNFDANSLFGDTKRQPDLVLSKVFIPFHWVFQKKKGRKKKKKERKKGEIVENQAHFICPPKFILCCYTIVIYISVLNLALLY